jgi:hypothetical protein
MNDFDLTPLQDLVREVLQDRNEQKLKEFIDKVDLYIIVEESDDAGSFPDSVFDFIMNLMDHEMFLTMDGSSKLLLVLETDWSRFVEEQRRNLLERIGSSYGRFKDWMSWFILSELLGQYYCNADAFHLLIQLKNTSDIRARSLVAHGFEHIAREAEDKILREQAVSQLRSMRLDPSPEVQSEAAEALAKVTKK